MPFIDTDVRIIIPQVRRALDPGMASSVAASGYSDDMIAAVTADSTAALIAIAGPTAFPYVLAASATDGNGWPTEWTIEPAPPPEIQSLIAMQSALTQAFTELRGLVSEEKISNQGATWEWKKSVNTLKDKVNWLIAQRNMALKNATRVVPELDAFVDLIAFRDPTISTDIGQST